MGTFSGPWGLWNQFRALGAASNEAAYHANEVANIPKTLSEGTAEDYKAGIANTRDDIVYTAIKPYLCFEAAILYNDPSYLGCWAWETAKQVAFTKGIGKLVELGNASPVWGRPVWGNLPEVPVIEYPPIEPGGEPLYNTGFSSQIEVSAPKMLSSPGTRGKPGVASGGQDLTVVNGKWLKGSEANAAPIPRQIADRLRGRTFQDFDEFREAFWTEVSNDPVLAQQFSQQNIWRMSQGWAPRVSPTQRVGGLKSYILHHRTPINQGGGVYDMDNLLITTPRYHQEVLAPSYHYGRN